MELDIPLHTAKDVYEYRFPFVDEEPFYEELVSTCERYGHDFAIIGGRISVFENSWYLRGFQNFLEDLLRNKEEAHFLVDRVMEYNLELGSRIIDAGVDVLNPVQPDCMDPEPQNISAIRGELR
jgi:uroporphyrinogen decarboxylase